ncbi:PD40 domain-containing protein [bacterium]|nr:PD40 domain-containing protein [bacterium]
MDKINKISLVKLLTKEKGEVSGIFSHIPTKGVSYGISYRDKKAGYCINGKFEKKYDDVFDFVYSKDGCQFAYAAKLNNKYFVIKNSQELDGKYDEILLDSLTFSDDGKSLAYIMKKNKKHYIKLNNLTLGPFDEIHPTMLFGIDNRTLAYQSRLRNKWAMAILDKRYTMEFKCMLMDFCYKQNHILYSGEAGGYTKVIYDEKAVGKYNEDVDGLALSDDGLHFAYSGDNSFFIDGKKINQYESVDQIVCNGGKFACCASQIQNDEDDEDVNSQVFVLGREEQKGRYSNILDPILTKDGKHFAFIADRNDAGKYFIVMDNKEIKPLGKICHSTFTLSKSGMNFAYLSEKDKKIGGVIKQCVVVNQIQGEPFDGLYSDIYFLENKNKVCYIVENNSEIFYIEQKFKAR